MRWEDEARRRRGLELTQPLLFRMRLEEQLLDEPSCVHICIYSSLLRIYMGRSYVYTSLLGMSLSDADKSLDFEDLEEAGSCSC
jgi:hypothetical protein